MWKSHIKYSQKAFESGIKYFITEISCGCENPLLKHFCDMVFPCYILHKNKNFKVLLVTYV